MYPINQNRYESLAFVLSLTVMAACLFAPLVAIAVYATKVEMGTVAPSAELTVGIAVLFRATARRLLRASFQNILRTTFATVSRAFARTATRRFIRIFAHSFFGAMAKQPGADERSEEIDSALDQQPVSPASSFIALATGFIGLALSFWGVLWVASHEGDTAAASIHGMPLPLACSLAALPIVVYGSITYVAARLFGVTVQLVTSLDGLLIQGYFTGAGSFLPMTTDINYRGPQLANAKLASFALASMLLLHWLLFALAKQIDSPETLFLSAMFLVYAFVYSFPIRPLEGSAIWRVSKLWWLIIFGPILASFLMLFPSDLAGLL